MRAPEVPVCVVGLGYVGLPTAALIANRGINVLGVDIDQRVVDTLNAGEIHIVEPDLGGLVRAVVHGGHLRAANVPEPAQTFVIAVPTPLRGDKRPEVGHVMSAAEAIAPVLRAGSLIILESTSPVGTTRRMCELLARLRPDLHFPHCAAGKADVAVAYCPERVLPGNVLRELVENDRIVGGMSEACAERALRFYSQFVTGACLSTTAETAEMTKLVENSYRDLNIAFANEISMICDRLAIDVWELIALANRHPRVNILQPGPGVGGHCIAVDPWFIVDSAPDEARLVRAAREVNDTKPEYVMRRVAREAEPFSSPRIACLGLAFKPNIDDLRESPACEIVRGLAQRFSVTAVEPHIHELPRELADLGVGWADTETAIGEADIVVALVKHSAFKTIDRSILDGKTIIDACGLLR